jgi:hypothetical protein
MVLLSCGILSSLLYSAMTVFVAMQWEGYSSASQTISELSAIGAPTRALWAPLGFMYMLLVIGFGWGVSKSAGRVGSLRTVGSLIVAYGALGLLWPFGAMHLRETLAAGGGTASDTMHLVLGMVTVVLMLLAMGFGAAAFGRQFRFYSIATIAVVLVFGFLTGLGVPSVQLNQPTPWLGVWERISAGGFLAWIIVLASTLLRAKDEGATTIGIAPVPRVTTNWRLGSRSKARQFLFLCGIVSLPLYLAIDILGGMRYPGYRFTSQGISELMAIGAPSERIVDPLFLAYGVLTLAFGVGVFREGASRSGALQAVGGLLIGYACLGFTGPTLFEVHPRGTDTLASAAPHIILTAALVLFMLLAIGCGAFALGRQFRVYSFATFLAIVALGVIEGQYGARLVAGQETPGFGIVERITIYSSLAWVAVLAVALLRRDEAAAERPLT